MRKFTSNLRIKILNNKIELLDDFQFLWFRNNKTKISPVYVQIPAGFKTDFRSTPNFFGRLFPLSHKYINACIMHNYLYTYGSEEGYSRYISDRFFLQAMELAGFGKERYYIFWKLRFCGGKNWKKS